MSRCAAPRPQAAAAEEDELVNRVRLRVGLVFQSFNLFPHLTALENVIEAPMTVKKMRGPRPRKSAGST